MPQKNIPPLEPGLFYHIYNRGIDKKPIFFNKGNYYYFLQRLHKYLDPIADIFCYCLLENHFHLLIQIKELDKLPEDFQDGKKSLSKPFSHAFNAYAQAINKQENRVGGLFQRPFRRVSIKSEFQLLRAVYYIHANPERHKIVPDFRDYWISSYKAIISNRSRKPSHNRVIDWFGGESEFLKYHQQEEVIASEAFFEWEFQD